MKERIYIEQSQKIKISGGLEQQSVEIGQSAVDNGFLKKFTGPSLAILLYLLTHLETGNQLNSNPVVIASYLPDQYSIAEIEEGLKVLSDLHIINISPVREGDYTNKITVRLEKLTANNFDSDLTQLTATKNNLSGPKLRKMVLTKSTPEESELKQAIISFAPGEETIDLINGKIDTWLTDFDFKMIKELIRRVDKWLTGHPSENGFYYLEGIISDWYQKDIHHYHELQHYDRLYREAKELASTYGIKGWQNVKPAHMETFSRWLSGDTSLSLALAKLAIKEAVRRKKDGQPSLKYIEDNFIIPWKKAGIKTVVEARQLNQRNTTANYKNKLKQQKSAKPEYNQINHPGNNQTRAEKRQQWDILPWDFEHFDVKGAK